MSGKILMIGLLCTFLIINKVTGIGTDKKRVNNEWVCLHSEDNISHFERWFANEKDSFIRERKCELLIDCDLGTVLRFINNPHNTLRWMREVKSVTLLSVEKSSTKYAHIIFKLPWPFEDKDMVASYETFRLNIDHYTIKVRSVKNLMDECLNIARIKEYQANWEITKTEGNMTKIVFTVISDIQPVIPRFIQDPIVIKVFIQNFGMLKKLLSEKMRYSEILSKTSVHLNQ